MEKIEPPLTGGERETLRGFLDHHRDVLTHKCAGLSGEQLREPAAPPSQLTLLGLVRHMAEVERAWFRLCANAEHDLPRVWARDDFQVAFDVTGADPAEAFAKWNAEVERAREVERSIDSLDALLWQPRWQERVTLRFVLVHMIEEYARHNGHADLLREALDGTTAD
ncbi:DinB family protein [Saccharopolyspora rhizosphaerae]|uniref:DinB family protein n=1 Tax=Saccharopolyspora rhizosphaerae TaxID=2492662 RepID=A0A426JYA7_9PSEU|nr:DinB family protein [Saccharopolyspora rhizosphaerae]RRO18041.1 DinB family protein [Saccharopolyspora rhizosphaerae]